MISKLFSALTLAVVASPALANVRELPEPGTLSLVGLAVAVGIGLALRKRK